MRDYSVFRSSFWTGETGRRLRENPDAQRLAAYLFTCGHSNLIGLYYLPLSYASHEVGMPIDRVSAAMEYLCSDELGFAVYDHQTEHVLVINAARQQLSRSPKAVAGALRHLRSAGSQRLRAEFESRFGQSLELLFADRVSIPSKPSNEANLWYRQDQDQDQDQEQSPDEPAASPAPKKPRRGKPEAQAALESALDSELSSRGETAPSISNRIGKEVAKRISVHATKHGTSIELAAKQLARSWVDRGAGNVWKLLDLPFGGAPRPEEPRLDREEIARRTALLGNV